jgi:plastocyanin
MKRKTSILGNAILMASLVLAARPASTFGASPDDKPSSEVAVKIDNFSFSPATITIPAGTTVRWTNRDDIPHTVVSDDKTFKSKPLDTDEQFTYTFTKAGTYSYFCSIHPRMTAKVVVQ